jgi:hypothetical protein
MKKIFPCQESNCNLLIILLILSASLLTSCAFPGFAKPTETPTPKPTVTPTITITPEPTFTPTLAETPTPNVTATPTIQYVITLGTFFDDKCQLAFEGDHLAVVSGCQDIKIDKFPIPRGKQVWFSIYIPGDESTYTETSSAGWIKLEANTLSEVDARGRMFACSPPGFGEYVCIVNILTPTGTIPLHLTISAALE